MTVITCAPNCPDGVVYEGYKNRWKQVEVIDGIRVVRVWTFVAANAGSLKRILNYLSYMFSAVLAAFFMKKPDVMVATSPQFFCGWAGVLLRKIRGFRFVLEIRDIWPESIVTVGAMKEGLGIRFLKWMEWYMYRTADHIVAVGKGYRDRIVEKNIDQDKVSVVYNGVDLNLYQKRTKDMKLVGRYGLEGKFVVSYIGTIGMAHALDIVLNAAEQIKDENTCFLMVGDGARRKELQEKAADKGLKNVIFTGRLSKEMMPSVWSVIDISFIHLKKSDLFRSVVPSKMFEAMAMERPIILGVDGESRTIVEEAGAGVFAEPENAAELVAVIQDLRANPNKAGDMGKSGRKYVSEKFDRNVLAGQYIDILTRISYYLKE